MKATSASPASPARRWTAWRPTALGLILAALTAFLVWNGIFGLHVSRGEKQYLIEEARYRLGERDAPSLPQIMDETVRAGAAEATRWALVVFVLTAAASLRPR
jgi:hypothetical protein